MACVMCIVMFYALPLTTNLAKIIIYTLHCLTTFKGWALSIRLIRNAIQVIILILYRMNEMFPYYGSDVNLVEIRHYCNVIAHSYDFVINRDFYSIAKIWILYEK